MGAMNENTRSYSMDEIRRREYSLLREARIKRNVSAFLDLASNLIAQLGRERGVQFSQPPQHAASYQKIYDTLNSRYKSLFGDYKGKIAAENLQTRLKRASQASVARGIDISPVVPQWSFQGKKKSPYTRSNKDINDYKPKNNKKHNYVSSKS